MSTLARDAKQIFNSFKDAIMVDPVAFFLAPFSSEFSTTPQCFIFNILTCSISTRGVQNVRFDLSGTSFNDFNPEDFNSPFAASSNSAEKRHIIQLIGAKSAVQQDGSQFEEDCEATMNFFHSTWQSCNGSKGYNKKRNALSTHKGQQGNGGDTKRKKPNPNFKPKAKSHPKEEWFELSKEQRDAVIKLRKEARQKKKDQADSECKRIVAAAIAKGQADQEQASESDQRKDQAGN